MSLAELGTLQATFRAQLKRLLYNVNSLARSIPGVPPMRMLLDMVENSIIHDSSLIRVMAMLEIMPTRYLQKLIAAFAIMLRRP